MTATIVGATGLIGNYLLEQLLDDPYYDTVRILVRRPIEFSHTKLEKKLVDFNDNDSLLIAISNSDVIFCAVGTTNKKVKGDKEAYRKIDLEIPSKLSRLCKLASCETFIVVSSMGASTTSYNFYAKLKGEMEAEVKKSGVNTIHIMRPSMLLGDRKESRPGEFIGKKLMTLFSFLIPENYKAIHGKQVAKAMVHFSKQIKEGVFIHDNNEIHHIS